MHRVIPWIDSGHCSRQFCSAALCAALILVAASASCGGGDAGRGAPGGFGSNGTAFADFGRGGNWNDDYAEAVAIQGDGKIVAAGWSLSEGYNNEFSGVALARFRPDGSVDPRFGVDGRVLRRFRADDKSSDSAYAVAIQGDGKIVVAGGTHPQVSDSSADQDFELARYGAGGRLDPGFGAGGAVATDFGTADESALAVATLRDGKIVAAGYSRGDFALARYGRDGRLDATFGNDGRVLTDFGGHDGATAIAVQRDGKIVAAGWSRGAFAVARYRRDGSLDPTFGADGKVITDVGSRGRATYEPERDGASAVALQADGKIIVAGGSGWPARNRDFALLRYTVDGSPDPGFGRGGTVLTDFQKDNDSASAIAIQRDGKIIAGGSSVRNRGGWRTTDFGLARYTVDGRLDRGFGQDGIILTGVPPRQGGAAAIALQADGKVVAVGYGGESSDFALVRYNPDGTLDS
jgi:uncharacterized delta-60 repeat protein